MSSHHTTYISSCQVTNRDLPRLNDYSHHWGRHCSRLQFSPPTPLARDNKKKSKIKEVHSVTIRQMTPSPGFFFHDEGASRVFIDNNYWSTPFLSTLRFWYHVSHFPLVVRIRSAGSISESTSHWKPGWSVGNLCH